MKSTFRSLQVLPYAFVCVSLALPLQVASAQQTQIGANSLSYSIDSESTYNAGGGYAGPNESGPTVSGTLTGGVAVKGVTGNGGTTYINCYDNYDGNIYSSSTTVDAQRTFSWTPSKGHTHATYCSASFTGNYANGTVQTGTVTFNT